MTEALSGEVADGSKPLAERLEAMRDSGADRFDPVRFRFIESLTRRASAQRPAVAQRLEGRALQALLRYEQARALAGEQAVAAISGSALQVSDASGSLQRLLVRLAREEGEVRANPEGAGLEQILRQQEEAMLKSLLDSGDAAPAPPIQSPPAARTELRSMRRCREVQVQRGAETLVTRAIGECPAHAGPLNSQRLAMRSLSTMQQLSPRYLQRFVAHLDTLYWLEQSAPSGRASASAEKGAKAGAGAKKSRRKQPQP